MFQGFFHFGHFASGQGLTKHFTSTRLSFAQIIPRVWQVGGSEFSNTHGLGYTAPYHVMPNLLHSKSSPGSTSSALSYSDSTKNVLSIDSPSYSILGDTTPEVFESVNSYLLNVGFISRFNIFEYKGTRGEPNEKADYNFDPKFIEHLVLLAKVTDQLTQQKKDRIAATLSLEAQIRYNKFKNFCNINYNRAILAKSGDIEHHMWSRSTLRINVLATLAAIFDTRITQQGSDGCANNLQRHSKVSSKTHGGG